MTKKVLYITISCVLFVALSVVCAECVEALGKDIMNNSSIPSMLGDILFAALSLFGMSASYVTIRHIDEVLD